MNLYFYILLYAYVKKKNNNKSNQAFFIQLGVLAHKESLFLINICFHKDWPAESFYTCL